MIRRLIAAVLFAAALPVFGADMDMAGVLEWSIPEGEVARVEVSGEVVWQYPYARDACSWVDLCDASTLWTDTAQTAPANVGDKVVRITDKKRAGAPWRSSMIRSVDGVAAATYADDGNGTGSYLYCPTSMLPAETDYDNCEFAIAIVTSNDRYPTNTSTSICRVAQPSSYKVLRVFWTSQKKLAFNSMSGTHLTLNDCARSDYSQGTTLYTIRAKSVQGTNTTVLSLNGHVVADVTQPVSEVSGSSLTPSISTSLSMTILPSDYKEMLGWDHIPEDWEQIEAALLVKYGIGQ